MKKTNRTGSRLFIGLVFLFLYAPIILLIIFSFNAGDSSAVWKGFSLHWYGRLFQNRLIMESVYTTLLVSLLATAIATQTAGSPAHCEQYPHDERGYCHRRIPVPVLRGLFSGLGDLRPVV